MVLWCLVFVSARELRRDCECAGALGLSARGSDLSAVVPSSLRVGVVVRCLALALGGCFVGLCAGAHNQRTAGRERVCIDILKRDHS